MKKCVTVYCGSSTGKNPLFVQYAASVGQLLATAGVEVITGAGAAGMMRAVADGALNSGGSVHGIIPEFMVRNGWCYDRLTRLTVTRTMHERKELMARLSDGVIALPGGVGTWEEFMEIVTWRQLGLYAGNIVLLNACGYYSPVVGMFDNAMAQSFIKPDHRSLFDVADSPEEAVRMVLDTGKTQNFSTKI